jgi:four helix bundle protein
VDEHQFKERTKGIALRVIKLIEALPRGRAEDVLARQLMRSATSIGANYRAACRARSAADMVSRLSVVEEEADEAIYWIELLAEAGYVRAKKIESLRNEIHEVVSMTVASIKTLRSRVIQNPKSKMRSLHDCCLDQDVAIARNPKSKI